MKKLTIAVFAVGACVAANCLAATGYFTPEALATADMTGVAENIERTLGESDGRFAAAEKLRSKLSGYAADMVATRLELARRLRAYIVKRHQVGTQEMELLAWQGAEELKSFYAYFAAEERRWTARTAAPEPITLNVRDFGARGDGATDDGPAFRAALAAAKEKGKESHANVTLKVPRGLYLIKPSDAPVPKTYVSRSWRDYNVDGTSATRFSTRTMNVYHDPSRFHLFAFQMENFTLQGEAGAELRFADASRGGIGFDCATETVVKDLTITYAERPFTQGTIAEIEAEPYSFVVRIDDGYPAPDLPRFLEARSRRITLHDANGLFLRNGTGRVGTVIPLGNGRFRLVRPDHMKNDRCWNEARKGDRFTIIARYSESAMGYPVYFITSSFSGAENVVIHDSPGQCFILNSSFAMRLLNCHARRRYAKDLLVSNADFMMCSGAIAPYVADCSAEYMEDDGLNFSSSTSLINDLSEDRTSFRNTSGLDSASGFQIDGVTGRVKAFLRRGRTWDRLAGKAAANTITQKSLPTVDAKAWLNANSWQGKAGEVKPDRILQIPGTSGGVVKNTRFANHRGMGVQVHCANMLIDGLQCHHLTGPGACINPLYGWGMMFNVHDILVRNTRLDDTTSGFVVKPGCVQPGITLTHAQIHGVELKNNSYKLWDKTQAVVLGNADDVVSEGRVLAPFNGGEELSDAAKMGAANFNRRTLEIAGGVTGGTRLVVLGNSITLAARHDEIGWPRSCGMAASAPEKDYVHLLIDGLGRRSSRGVDYRIKNIATFERGWKGFDLAQYDHLVAFKPEILVVAIGENMANLTDDSDAFEAVFADLIGRFKKANPACRIVVRGVFWPNSAKDAAMKAVAQRLGCAWVEMSDFGRHDEYKALGLYTHRGVAGHPGDKGMAVIADRLLKALE